MLSYAIMKVYVLYNEIVCFFIFMKRFCQLQQASARLQMIQYIH